MGTLWEWKFQNAAAPTVIVLFKSNVFWKFLVRILTKVAYRNFEISNYLFFKNIEI